MLLDGADPDALARAGVGWVVVQHGTPGALGRSARTLERLTPAYSDGELTLYRLGGDQPSAPRSHRLTVLGAHLVWASMVAGGAVTALAASRRRHARADGGSRRGSATPAAG